MKLRFITIALLASIGYSAHAFDLDPSFAGGESLSGESPNGDTATLTDPIHVDSSGSDAQTLADLMNENSQWFSNTPNVEFGADIAGTFSLDQLTTNFVADGGDGRYFTGWNFAGRLNTPDGSSIPDNLRFVFMESGDFGTYVFTEGFGPTEPYFYPESEEASNRDGTNAYGAFNYQINTNLAYESAVGGPYTQTNTLFLVDETTDAVTGDEDVTIHDGVQWTGTYTQVGPVPEPASIAMIGLGAFGLLRRRRR